MNNKIEATAKRIHARARKFTKRQIAAMTAVTMGLAAVTVATYSQEPVTPEVGKTLIAEKFRRLKELRDKFSAMSAKEQQQALIENGRDIQVYMAGGSSQRGPFSKRENITHISFIDAGKTIVIPDTKDEVVSLRREFEKLGVTATQQIGDTCTIYSAFHLMQFVSRKSSVNPIGIEEFKQNNLHPTVMFADEAVGKIAVVVNKPMQVTWIQSPLNNLNHEITKDLLRRGIPSTISWRPTKADGYEEGGPSAHASVAVGFRVKGGVTEWEILDSNQVSKDKGYKFILTQGTVGLFGIEVK